MGVIYKITGYNIICAVTRIICTWLSCYITNDLLSLVKRSQNVLDLKHLNYETMQHAEIKIHEIPYFIGYYIQQSVYCFTYQANRTNYNLFAILY